MTDPDHPAFKHLPQGSDLLALPPDNLGLRLLGYITEAAGSPRREEICRPNWWPPEMLGDAVAHEFSEAMAEAWDWLMREGLLSYRPPQPGDSGMEGRAFVTRLGRRVAADPGQLGPSRLEQGLQPLDPELLAEVRPLMLIGNYEAAVTTAMRRVEIRTRTAAQLPQAVVGVELMRQALGPKGPLRDPDPAVPEAEKDALAHLFAGAIGWFRNPPSHRDLVTDATEAGEAVRFADLLLRLLRRAEARVPSGGTTNP